MDAALFGDVVAGVGAVAAAATRVAEAVKGIGKPSKPLTGAIAALQSETFSLQQTVLRLQTEILQLGEKNLALERENAQLREQVRAGEQRSLERHRYHLQKVGNASVVVADGDADTLYCPSCWAKDSLAIPLQMNARDLWEVAGSHCCPSCKADINVL